MVNKERFPKKRPIGSYEKLLCEDCDQKIGVYDNYAQSILLGELEFYPEAMEKAYIIENYDYKKLKLFFISLLWRSSISKLEEFKLIDVGPFEPRLRELIIGEDLGLDDEFSVFITRFDSRNEKIKFLAEKNILFPAKQKMDGLNYSIFYLTNGYKIYIKVDKRSSLEIYKKFILKKNKPLVILRIANFEKSQEFKIMCEAVLK